MVINFDCVRGLLLYIAEIQKLDHLGKPDPIHLKRIYDDEALAEYTRDEINCAATYIVEKGLMKIPVPHAQLAPRAYVFSGISAEGYDYIAAIKDEKIWHKIKAKLGSTALASVPTVIGLAAQFLAG